MMSTLSFEKASNVYVFPVSDEYMLTMPAQNPSIAFTETQVLPG